MYWAGHPADSLYFLRIDNYDIAFIFIPHTAKENLEKEVSEQRLCVHAAPLCTSTLPCYHLGGG